MVRKFPKLYHQNRKTQRNKINNKIIICCYIYHVSDIHKTKIKAIFLSHFTDINNGFLVSMQLFS